MKVVMMEQMSLENSVEKSDKKNDQDQVDGMRQEGYLQQLCVYCVQMRFYRPTSAFPV